MKRLAALLCIAGAACLNRPVVTNEPTTKDTFFEERKLQAVDKIDLLLAIDNSASMKDKQEFLAKAVPRLVERLVTPNCVTNEGKVVGPAQTDERGEGLCPAESRPEFKPITDIHVGIVSSSLGNFGADSFDDGKGVVCKQPHADDHAQLIGRGLDADDKAIEVQRENANFLAWFPSVEKNAGKPKPAAGYDKIGALSESFASLVRGTDDQGCGLEAQLESMYQFLIAPQPWDHIEVDPGSGKAKYVGINTNVLRQRHDFLRPGSLVAVIMLTDEDDSSVDPLSVSGTGHYFMNQNFPQNPAIGTVRERGTAARGTAICATDPASPDCTSCAFGGCPPDETYYLPEDDDLNVRFFDMKRRFGVDPQYPLERYVRGLTQAAIPSRDAEHGGAEAYDQYDVTAADCTNPLFHGAELPLGTESMEQLCKLRGGEPRDRSLVFFALVGGVPNELIGADRRDPKTNELTADAWTALLGSDPGKFQDRAEDGKDLRMVQSTAPRGDRRSSGEDVIGNDELNVTFRDYDTGKSDLQYACTFPLARPLPADESIDCNGTANAPRNAPLCAPGAPTTEREQIRAKAYPTIREARLVRELRSQGILGSLCPKETKSDDEASATYGYNPVVNEIVDRLRNAITAACLPHKLERDANGKIPCLMLEVMPEGLDCSGEGRERGRGKAEDEIVQAFRKKVNLPESRKVCRLEEDTTATSPDECQAGDGGWCYLDGAAAGRCEQLIVFNDAVLGRAKGSRVYLQCISEYSTAQDSEPTKDQ